MEKIRDISDKFKQNTNIIINDIKSNPSSLIFPLLLIIVLTIISYILFSKTIKNYINKDFVLNKEFLNKNNNNNNNNNTTTIFYFYTEWCPYCKKSRPEWDKFKELLNLQSFSDDIEVIEVDCDKETELANKYSIEGYPTIKLVYQGEIYDFDAKPDSQIILEFVQSVIKPNQ